MQVSIMLRWSLRYILNIITDRALCMTYFYFSTSGPVPYGICRCSFVETTDTQSYITPVYVTFPWLVLLPTLTLLLNTGFHGASATGAACRQGTLTLPDTWFRTPIVGLACAPIVETRFLELAMSLLDFSPRIPLGTFSILLFKIINHYL